ncbi:putative Trypsin [Daphnia magna]|uniref:Putative Trypsin n=1 Tax=Daphnia magna TaxID=35525 RepID=A0A164TNB2_9CRUS|nr:putative Trypsin [Daphnia magna]
MPKRLALQRPISFARNSNSQRIPQEKIVGGYIVAPNSLPFQVSIQRRPSPGADWMHYCGGSILDSKFVVTAAHCVSGGLDIDGRFSYRIDANNLRVVAGEHSLSIESGLEQKSMPVSVIVHEKFNPDTFQDDIALVFMKKNPLNLSVPSAKPIKLPPHVSQYDPLPGTRLNVSGWGFTEPSPGSSERLSDVLRTVNIGVISDGICDKTYGGSPYRPIVLPSMLCAGDMTKGGIDSCQGDSGGPLFASDGDSAVLHGIVSWGEGCALASFPGIYTQVSYYLDWMAAQRAHFNSLPRPLTYQCQHPITHMFGLCHRVTNDTAKEK